VGQGHTLGLAQPNFGLVVRVVVRRVRDGVRGFGVPEPTYLARGRLAFARSRILARGPLGRQARRLVLR
jgi:hypothetical protein